MKRWLLFPMILFSVSAWAQSDTAATRGTLSDEPVMARPVGWMPYLGAGAGYTTSDITGNDSNLQEGMPSAIKVLGSYYTRGQKGVFDLGYGYNNQQFSREAAPARSVSGPSIEAAARYQWDSRWQAGVVATTLFDRGEFYGANQADAQFAGLQALKEFNLSEDWIARFGGRVLTDLNVNGETVNMALIDLQIGWNPWNRRQSVRDVASTPVGPAGGVRAPTPEPAIGRVRIESDRPGFVHFEFDSDRVQNADRNRVRDLVRVLENNSDLYEQIELIGHTDSVGTAQYNQGLSERRAASLRDLLVEAGWDRSRIRTEGRGEKDLAILSELAPNFGDNRRVEIQFSGVKDQGRLREILSRFE